MKRVLYLVSEDWAFVTHRLHIARDAIEMGYEVGVLTKVTNKANEIEAFGIKMFGWRLQRGSINPFNLVLSILETIKILSKYQPDVIHAVALKSMIIAGFSGFFYKNVPILFEFGGVGFIFSSKAIQAKILKAVVCVFLRVLFKGKNRHIIVQNKDDKSLLEAAKLFSAKNVFFIPGAGVERDLYQPSKIPHWSDLSPPIVVLPARLLWDKGVGEFVRLSVTAKKRGLNARFVLVGEPDKENREAIPLTDIDKWVDNGSVEWWGKIDNMPSVFSRVSIVCFPSYREGLPKVLLEAMSCARPIVCFDVPGCRDVVRDKVNGFLVPLGNEPELLNRVCQLLSDRELTTRMGTAGSEIAAEQFDGRIISRKVMNIWNHVSK